MPDDSVFSKIIRGEIPSHKIYEDDKTFAFLDINPVQPGQVLIVPKTPIGKFYELPDDDLTALFLAAKTIAVHMEKTLGKRITVQIEGFDMPDHTHVKLIPANCGDEFRARPQSASQDDLAAMAERLRLN
jgi:histidine triad (HIT) family protein